MLCRLGSKLDHLVSPVSALLAARGHALFLVLSRHIVRHGVHFVTRSFGASRISFRFEVMDFRTVLVLGRRWLRL
jgi:hypothetical protein